MLETDPAVCAQARGVQAVEGGGGVAHGGLAMWCVCPQGYEELGMLAGLGWGSLVLVLGGCRDAGVSPHS